MKLTANDVATRVAHISMIQFDDEKAHSEEDALYITVLDDIAQNSTDADARYIARLALTVRDMGFARWCA